MKRRRLDVDSLDVQALQRERPADLVRAIRRCKPPEKRLAGKLLEAVELAVRRFWGIVSVRERLEILVLLH